MYPKFLCIGAQKAGTTWLHANLKQHPDIWLPHAKEIHYFSYFNEQGQPPRKRLTNPYWTKYRIFRRLGRDVVDLSFRDFNWDLRYFFSKRDDVWYAGLFEPGQGKITGDITPAYAALDKHVIRHVFELMPDTKLIFMMRNPIERAWSAALMNIRKKRPEFQEANGQFAAVTYDDFVRYFEQEGATLRGDYIHTLENWLTYFPRKKFFIAFLEDVGRRPRELLLEIYQFLGVASDPQYLTEAAQKKVLAGTGQQMPEEIGRYLADSYYPQIEQLAKMFSGRQAGYIQEWRQMANSLLGKTGVNNQVANADLK